MATKARLCVRAAQHSRSMEQEAREATEHGDAQNLGELIRALVEPLGGVDLPEFPDEPIRKPPRFAK